MGYEQKLFFIKTLNFVLWSGLENVVFHVFAKYFSLHFVFLLTCFGTVYTRHFPGIQVFLLVLVFCIMCLFWFYSKKVRRKSLKSNFLFSVKLTNESCNIMSFPFKASIHVVKVKIMSTVVIIYPNMRNFQF